MVIATPTAPRTKFDLLDSRDLFGDGESLRAVLRRDGYIFMRGLLYRDWVEDVGRHGLGAIQDAGWTEPDTDPLDARPRLPVRAVAMRDAFGDPGYQRILADPGFNAIPYDSPLTWLMRQIMGDQSFCYPLKLPRLVYPSSVVPRQPGNIVHKDFGAVQDMLTCWVPLQDIPPSLGGLAVQPGSQTSSRVRFHRLKRLERGWRTTHYEPGDVLVFHCMTTHAALPNNQDRMRFSGEYRWQMADQPAPRRLVVGPQGREMGSRAFDRTDWWRPVPPGLQLFDDRSGGPGGRPRRPAGARGPVPPSRFVDCA